VACALKGPAGVKLVLSDARQAASVRSPIDRP
jgi:hypothetical protein